MTSDATAARPVLYLAVCGAPPAAEVHELVKLAQADGWDVWVLATPDGTRWLDVEMLAELTGHDVSTRYRMPDEGKRLPPANAIVVAPATFNTVNKFRAGIADNLVVGTLCECLQAGVPIVVAPNVKAVLAEHHAFPASLAELASWGVHVLDQADVSRGRRMPAWESVLAEVDRHVSRDGDTGRGA